MFLRPFLFDTFNPFHSSNYLEKALLVLFLWTSSCGASCGRRPAHVSAPSSLFSPTLLTPQQTLWDWQSVVATLPVQPWLDLFRFFLQFSVWAWQPWEDSAEEIRPLWCHKGWCHSLCQRTSLTGFINPPYPSMQLQILARTKGKIVLLKQHVRCRKLFSSSV